VSLYPFLSYYKNAVLHFVCKHSVFIQMYVSQHYIISIKFLIKHWCYSDKKSYLHKGQLTKHARVQGGNSQNFLGKYVRGHSIPYHHQQGAPHPPPHGGPRLTPFLTVFDVKFDVTAFDIKVVSMLLFRWYHFRSRWYRIRY